MTFRLTISAIMLLALTTQSDSLITGKIYSSDSQHSYNFENVDVILRCDNKPFDTVRTNDKGEFSVAVPRNKHKNIDILYTGIGFGIIYLKHISQLLTDTTILQIDIANYYKMNDFGIAICPKCNKTNRIYKVRYDIAPVYVVTINDNGDTTISPIHDGVYEAGTCVSSLQSAQWYCDRDKIEF